MTDAVIVGLIAAIASIIAAYLTSKSTHSKIQEDLRVSNEVQNIKIETLTEEVKKHNNFAERIPVIEGKQNTMEFKIDTLDKEIKEIKKKIA